MTTMTVEASLDTSIVSGAARGQLEPAQRSALDVILEAHESGRIRLVRSKTLDAELSEIPEQYRSPHDEIAARLIRVPPIYEYYPPRTNMTVGGIPDIVEDPRRTELVNLLPHVDDADHIFQASRNGIKFFVTRDEKSILRFAPKIEAIADVKAVSLEQFVDILKRPAGA
jgi:hypothetical protein